MFRDYCKPALFGIFVGVLICVEARPAENNAHSIGIPNKSDSVQMLDGNLNLNRNRERNSDVWPWRSFSKRTSGNEPFRRPPSATAAQASDANVDSAIENRKLSSVVTGAETDVECKSQSKPLFFKSILNRLRWSDSPPSPSPSPSPASLLSYHQPVKSSHDQSQPHSSTFVVSEESVQPPQPSSRLECRSQSNALNVKNTNSRPVFEYLRNDKQYEPESAPVFAPEPSSYYDLQSSASHQTGPIWHPFIQRPNVPDAEDHSIRKFHPSAPASLLPNSFAYYPYSSSLDNDYYQAVAAAAAAAARKPSTTEEIDLLPNKAENVDVKANTTANSAEDQASIDGGHLTVNVKNTQNNDTRQQWQQPLTKIILRPRASATAGKQGIAISSPISAAYVKRGDYVEIEYLPESEANVGEGGVAISRPELVIHFVDRRK